MSLLKPEVSIPTALATAVVVYAIHQNATPTMADVRSAPSGDKNIASSERQASWLSAGIVAGISLLAKDPTIFTVGGAAVIGMAWWTRHANSVNPITQAATLAGVPRPAVTEAQGAYDDAPMVA